jgi:hypothetical protein
MKINNRRPRTHSTYSVIIALIFVLTGCGGGAEEDAPQSQTSNQPSEPDTTALDDNIAPDQYDFDQFNSYTLTLDIPSVAASLAGNYYVIKLYDNQFNTYLLVTQTEPQLITPTVSVPSTLSTLTLEIYTDLAEYGSVIKEIQL